MENNNLDLLEKLTMGTKHIETVLIETDDGEELEFSLRPLTSGELNELKSLEKLPFKMKMKLNGEGQVEKVEKADSEMGMDISMGKMNEYTSKVIYNSIAKSLSHSGVEVSSKQIRMLERPIPELLFMEVIRISKLTEDDLTAVKTFRLHE